MENRAVPDFRDNNRFCYKPLEGSRSIRLITVKAGAPSSDLHISLPHVSLDSEPAFEALSYVWGPQYPSRLLQSDEGVFDVGPNLYNALLHLRRSTGDRLVWIDRLAIDQDNTNERSAQVAMMADIYRAAAQVVVWLGLEDENTAAAFAMIQSISTEITARWKAQSGNERPVGPDLASFPPRSHAGWSAVKSLLQRPWFERVWTFQEIVLARRAVVHCGAKSLGWNVFHSFFGYMATWPDEPNVQDSRLQGADKFIQDVLTIRSSSFLDERQSALAGSLMPLLDRFRTRMATDPRDKVFGLLGVASDAGHSDLVPDYNKSLVETYAMTAKWLLRRHESLAFLSLVEIKDKPDLISWVPDFRYKDALNFLHQPRMVFRGSGNERLYAAAGASTASLTDAGSLFQVAVHGVSIGTVVERTDPPGNLLGNVALGAAVFDGGAWHQFARRQAVDGKYSATGENIDLAYHRMRLWDLLPEEGTRRRQRASPPTEVPQPEPITYNRAWHEHQLEGASNSISMAILRGTTRKRMFLTSEGYLGLAHRSLEVGDKVYVLMGADTPMVLRPIGSGGMFHFRGEAYVHGIMDGEALAKAKARKAGRQEHLIDRDDLQWLHQLDSKSWPFDTERLTLA